MGTMFNIGIKQIFVIINGMNALMYGFLSVVFVCILMFGRQVGMRVLLIYFFL